MQFLEYHGPVGLRTQVDGIKAKEFARLHLVQDGQFPLHVVAFLFGLQVEQQPLRAAAHATAVAVQAEVLHFLGRELADVAEAETDVVYHQPGVLAEILFVEIPA